jgi:hypothetical protein
MLTLTDEEAEIVRRACVPINPSQRQAFIETIAQELGRIGARSLGTVARTAGRVQARYRSTAVGAERQKTGFHRRPWSPSPESHESS